MDLALFANSGQAHTARFNRLTRSMNPPVFNVYESNMLSAVFVKCCRSLPQEEVEWSITLAKYTELWLREIAPGKLTKPTPARDRQDIDCFLPVLGHYKLTELRPEYFRQLHSGLRKVKNQRT